MRLHLPRRQVLSGLFSLLSTVFLFSSFLLLTRTEREHRKHHVERKCAALSGVGLACDKKKKVVRQNIKKKKKRIETLARDWLAAATWKRREPITTAVSCCTRSRSSREAQAQPPTKSASRRFCLLGPANRTRQAGAASVTLSSQDGPSRIQYAVLSDFGQVPAIG